MENPSSAVPEAVTELDFSALKKNSPFLRSLDLSESLTLTGIARIEEDLYATLFDKESKQTHIVSRSANPQGWRMVGVAGDQTDLGTLTAKISVEGGEVFSVRFDVNQLKPGEGRPGAFREDLWHPGQVRPLRRRTIGRESPETDSGDRLRPNSSRSSRA